MSTDAEGQALASSAQLSRVIDVFEPSIDFEARRGEFGILDRLRPERVHLL